MPKCDIKLPLVTASTLNLLSYAMNFSCLPPSFFIAINPNSYIKSTLEKGETYVTETHIYYSTWHNNQTMEYSSYFSPTVSLSLV